jgi:hypothetical protein
MSKVSHTLSLAASRHIARVASHLNQAGKQLSAATQAAPNRYHQQRLRRLLADLRGLSLPVDNLASSLQRRGGQ